MKKLVRTIHPEVKIISADGVVDYIASDESIDSYREVIRAKGWKFTHFKKNSPFVDSHSYDSVDKLLGKVTSFKVRAGQLVERVQWAIDVAENRLAQIGWKMTEAGYLKAVSVGFYPVAAVSAWGADQKAFADELKDLGLKADTVDRVYLKQEQIELSAVIIGSNPNALAKAYKADCLQEEDMDTIAKFYAEHETAPRAAFPGHVREARVRARAAFLEKLNTLISN